MTPPGETKTRGAGYFSDLPPKDFYSPKACHNCHSDDAGKTTAASSHFKPPNPKNLTFLDSPSICTAEIHWPNFLRNYHRFDEQARSQNYLAALLLSRQDRLPFEIKGSSIRLYLGLTGQLALPDKDGALQLAVQIADDGGVCERSNTASSSELEACQGLQMKIEDDDLVLPLRNKDLLSGQDLKIGRNWVPWLKAEIAKLSVRDGRFIASFRLNNSFLNSGVVIFNKFSSNPYDSDLYDFDATDLLLKNLPVAYNPNSHAGLNYEKYQAATDKNHLKTIPYLFNIVREGKLPDQLSLNHAYEAAMEMLKNIKKPEDEKNVVGNELINKLIEKIAFQIKLQPRRLLLEKLYVAFEDATGKNLVQAKLNGDHLRDWQLQATAPLQIRRLFAPGIVDLSGLQADLNLQFDNKKASELSLDNLDLQLAPMEYLRENPDKPGLFAVLGGSIRGGLSNNPLITTPPIQIRGNFTDGFKAEANLRLDAVSLRLPTLGNVTISGDLAAKLTVVPRQETVELPSGEERKVTRWILQPGSLHFSLSNLDLKTALGLHSTGGTIELYDDFMGFGPFIPVTSNELRLRVQIPSIGNGAFKSLDIDGKLPWAIAFSDGSYDLQSLAQAFSAQLRIHARRGDGNQEDWDLKFNGSHTPDKTYVEVALDSEEKKPSGAVKRLPVKDLKIRFDRERIGPTNSYTLNLGAKQVDFPKLQLLSPRLNFKWVREELDAGKIHYSAPVFELTANDGKTLPTHGDLRGLLSIKSLNPASKPPTVDLDEDSHTLTLNNLNLSFRAEDVTDEALTSATQEPISGKEQISGIDIDGSVLGPHWEMDYTNFKGKGRFAVVGDGEGDIHLRGPDRKRLTKPDPRDPKGSSVEIPLLSKTLWQVTRTNGINGEINGNFSLSTDVDPAAIAAVAAIAKVFGIVVEDGKVLHLEINPKHLPYTINGFLRKIEEYLAIKTGGNKP